MVFSTNSYICDYTQRCVNPWNVWPYVRYIWLVTPIAHMCSIWLVVLVATNRYWAVCRPHAAARVWITRRTVGYVAAVVVGVVAFNSPRLFEYRIVAVPVAANATAAVSPTTTEDHLPNVETEPEPETELVLREMRTEFGQSAFYRYVYKVLFVNILLVLLPLVTLIVLSVFVVRALRQTPSYRLSLVHTRPRGCSDPPATAKVALTNIREEEDLVVVDDEVEQHQQTAADNGEPASVRPARGSTVKEFRSQSKFSLKSLKVYET